MPRIRMHGQWFGRFHLQVLALLLLSAAAVALTPQAKPNPDPERFANEIRAFEQWDRKNSAVADAVLFAGSSSIRMWPTHEAFPTLPVINRGFGGAHISDVIHFADRVVLPYKARVIVFYAGDNDIADGKSPEQVRDDFKSFVQLVRTAQPQVLIIYLPIKPSVARWSHWPQMQQANKLIRELCESGECLTYIDVATPLLGSDGQPRADLLLEDGLHLNAEGYKVWTHMLTPILRRLMRD
ncbi:MAG: SGNH/GDSL hydrolase family protein [Phycisphaerae bacterium]|jgi:lysophospholipase L1-like esterase